MTYPPLLFFPPLAEQNFILKLYLSNNEIPKAGHYNRKKTKQEEFVLNFLLKNAKLLL